MADSVTGATGLPTVSNAPEQMYRVSGDGANFVHTDAIINYFDVAFLGAINIHHGYRYISGIGIIGIFD